MDQNIIGSVSRLKPVQALLGDVDKLYDLARDKDVNARSQLADEISQFFNAELTIQEGELVADVLIELLMQAEHDMKSTLSQKLAVFDNVPLRLVLEFANDHIDIAAPMLTQSSVLGEFDLMYIIKSKSAEYWRAIAQRQTLSDQVVTMLAKTEDLDTALILAEHDGVSLSDTALIALVDQAQQSEQLAAPLLRRNEITAELAQFLYAYVGNELKTYIQINYDAADVINQAIELIDQTVNELVCSVETVSDEFSMSQIDLEEVQLPRRFTPDRYMIEEAQCCKAEGRLNVALMMDTIHQNRMANFVAQFSVYTDIPVAILGQVFFQKSGKSLSLIAKAYGIEKQAFVSIFMMISRIWNEGRMVEIDEIKGALEYYDKAARDLALRIVQEKMQLQ